MAFQSARGTDPADIPGYGQTNGYGPLINGNTGYLRVIDPTVPRGYRNVGQYVGPTKIIQAETAGATYKAPEFNMSNVSTMPVSASINDRGKPAASPYAPAATTTPGMSGAPGTGPQGQTKGYTQALQWSNPQNPYAPQQAQDSAAGAQAGQYASSNIQQLQAQSAKAAGGYPAMPNSYGLGNSSSFAPTAPAGPITQPAQDSGSRGFNPWSLVGEASSRGK